MLLSLRMKKKWEYPSGRPYSLYFPKYVFLKPFASSEICIHRPIGPTPTLGHLTLVLTVCENILSILQNRDISQHYKVRSDAAWRNTWSGSAVVIDLNGTTPASNSWVSPFTIDHYEQNCPSTNFCIFIILKIINMQLSVKFVLNISIKVSCGNQTNHAHSSSPSVHPSIHPPTYDK